MYRNQFLLSKNRTFDLNWQRLTISDYYLYIHPGLEISVSQNSTMQIIILGVIFDWKNPGFSYQNICDSLLDSHSLDSLLSNIDQYSGEFAVIAEFEHDLYIFNDAGGQLEIYYTSDFECFGSQVKIIEEVSNSYDHSNVDAVEFYKSDIFKKKKIFPAFSTHRENILHLRPNHVIEVKEKRVRRFFPLITVSRENVQCVAEKSAIMIKGYLKSATFKNELALAVTAGYDSRILFLASTDLNCKYFVFQHPDMDDDHYDIAIPEKLVSNYKKKFLIIPDQNDIEPELNEEYKNSIDFPRYLINSVHTFSEHLLINGNVSEIARNYFGYHMNATAKDLCYLSGYSDSKYVTKLYDSWLKDNKNRFKELGYNYLDMFYWEEKMGNWAAKSKTESRALGRKVFSPFNSRALLQLLLSVDRKYRDSHHNKLYDEIISYLCGGKSEVIKLPINPTPKVNSIKLMKRLHVYNLYRSLFLKFRLLK